MSENVFASVWPGLNSYREADHGRFYGRTEEISALVHAIGNSEVCTVYGPSGVGKTSLLRAGVFPVLKETGFFPVGIRLEHLRTAPGYGVQIFARLREVAEASGVSIRETVPPSCPEVKETLWEWLHRHVFLGVDLNPVRPVILLDQFEEIFTLGETNGRETEGLFAALEDLCTNSIPESVMERMSDSDGELGFPLEECNWRLVLSLREDFLPRLEEATARHPALRANRMAVKALRREQAFEAVTGPGKNLVSAEVARSIVEIVGASKSGVLNCVEPALLSLFCSRLDLSRQRLGLAEITEDLLSKNRDDILSGYYDEAIGKVSAATAERLEERLLTSAGYRDSWAVEDAERAGILTEEWKTLVDERLLHVDYRGGIRWLEYSHDVLTKVAADRRLRRQQNQETARLRALAESQRRKVKRLVALLCSIVAGAAIVTAGIWFLFYRERVEYYRAVVKEYGKIKGVGPRMTAEQVRHRWFSYRLHYRGYCSFVERGSDGGWPFVDSPVHLMEIVDRRGRVAANRQVIATYLWNPNESSPSDHQEDNVKIDDGVERTDIMQSQDQKLGGAIAIGKRKSSDVPVQSPEELLKVCQCAFEFDRFGRVEKELGLDMNGKVVWMLSYARSADGREKGCPVIAHFIAENGLPLRQRKNDKAEYVRISYDKRGRESSVEYLDPGGALTKGLDGAHATFYEWDEMGRRTMTISRRWSPNQGCFTNIIDNAGNTGVRLIYSPDWKTNFVCSFNIETNECLVKGGYCKVRHVYDSWGNLESTFVYGLDGRLTTCANSSVAGLCWNYDDFSRTETYLGTNGFPVDNGNGAFVVVELYDKMSKIIEQHYYSQAGSGGVAGSSNVHHMVQLYDGAGFYTNEFYYGVNGARTTNAYGVYLDIQAKGSSGRTARCDLYAPDGTGGIWGEAAVHHVVRLYDDRGNNTNQTFWGVGGVPVTNGEGVARYEDTYSESGKRVRRDLYSRKGSGGVWGFTNVHHGVQLLDADGNATNQYYFGVAGNRVTDNDGREFGTVDYGPGGTILRIDSYAPDGCGGLGGDTNVHHLVRLYDGTGFYTNELYYGTDGSRAVNGNGVFLSVEAKSKSGRTARRDLYAPDGYGGVWGNAGINHAISLYDTCGNNTNETFWGVGGESVTNAEGVARYENTFNVSGKYARRDFYSCDGRGGIWGHINVHHCVQLMDANGNATNQYYFGVAGNRVTDNDGRVSVTADYGSGGAVLRIDFYAPDGCGGLAGDANVHHLVRLYDGAGFYTNEFFYGVNGSRTTDANGVFLGVATKDAFGRLARVDLYAPDGKGGVWGSPDVCHIVQHYEKGVWTGDEYRDVHGASADCKKVAVGSAVKNPSRALGVGAGWVLCRFGDYALSEAHRGDILNRTIKAKANQDKSIVIARPFGTSYEIVEYEFGPGLMGIQFQTRLLKREEYDRIMELYDIWRKNRNGTHPLTGGQ